MYQTLSYILLNFGHLDKNVYIFTKINIFIVTGSVIVLKKQKIPLMEDRTRLIFLWDESNL